MSFGPITMLCFVVAIIGAGVGVRYTFQVDDYSRELRNLQSEVQGLTQIVETKQQIVQSGQEIVTNVARLEAEATKADEAIRGHENGLTELETTYNYLCSALPEAVDRVRRQAVGEEFAEFATTSGQVYKKARIKEVTNEGISILHDSGSSRVSQSDLPAELVERFRIGKPLPSPSDVSSLVKFERSPLPVKASGNGASRSTPRDSLRKPPATDAPTSDASKFDPNLVVYFETDAGRGSGFIAEDGGVAYVYTNAHVICGNPGGFATKIQSITTASGKKLGMPIDIQLSDSFDPSTPNGLEDIARFRVDLPAGVKGYELGDESAPLTFGMAIVAYGNSLGAGVMTSIDGKILGLGTDRLEISCEIVPGNSGGPVVATETNKVIGISTYADTGERDIWSSGTRFGQIRRFAVRPEQVKKWRTMRYTDLQYSLKQLASFDRDTLSLAAACFLNPTGNRGGFETPTVRRGDFVVREVIADGVKYRLGKAIAGGIAQVNQKLGGTTSTYSVPAVVSTYQNFFATVAKASQSQTSELANSDRAPYLKQFVADLVEVRKAIHDEFVKQGASRFR